MTHPGKKTAKSPMTSYSNISKETDLREKLMNWLIFNIFIATLPILLHIAILFGNAKPIMFFDLFSHGELLLISVATTADAMGELILKGKTKGFKNGLAIGMCIIISFFSISWFASLGIGGAVSNVQGFAVVSIVLFIVSVVVSANCKALAEV